MPHRKEPPKEGETTIIRFRVHKDGLAKLRKAVADGKFRDLGIIDIQIADEPQEQWRDKEFGKRKKSREGNEGPSPAS